MISDTQLDGNWSRGNSAEQYRRQPQTRKPTMQSRREIQIAGETIWLCAITGTVTGEKKWAESRVSGGDTFAHGALYRPGRSISIKTQVNTRHEFWLIAPDGEERCVKLGDSKLAVRDNQVLTAIWGARQGRDNGPFLFLRNHNAGTEHWLASDETAVLRGMGIRNPMVLWGLAGIVAGLLLLALFQMSMLIPALLLMGGGAFYGKLQRTAKVRNIREAAAAAIQLELAAGRQMITQSASAHPSPLLESQLNS